MKIKNILLLCILILIVGCAAYKELEPVPEIKFFENDYIELKDDDEFFELDKDNKYFIKFPPAFSNNIYLVLDIQPKSMINFYLTDRFDDGEGIINKMPDLNADSEKYSVYALDKSALNYYWVIEKVKSDIILECKYRYVAAWRYKFENSYSELLNKFKENQVQKDIYNTLGVEIHSDQIAIDQELINLKSKNNNLNTIKNSLQEIENILPANIKNSTDQAFLDYTDLKNKLRDEIYFQNNYQRSLNILKTEKIIRNDPAKFSAAIPELLSFYDSENPKNIQQEIDGLLSPQLNGIVAYYNTQLLKKNDKKRITLDAKGLEKLFSNTGKKTPDDLSAISKYIQNYNSRIDQLNDASKPFSELKSDVKSAKSWPSNSFYLTVRSRLGKIKAGVPEPGSKKSFGKYSNSKSAQLLNSAITSLKNEVNNLERNYDKASDVVQQINQLKERSNYRAIIKLLKNNSRLDFLRIQYGDVDQLSLKQQKNSILAALQKNDFASVESGLQSLYNDNYFLNIKAANKFKAGLIKSTEDTVINRIERQSKQRALAFVEENYLKTNNVDQLYANPAFVPVHNLNFTSGDPERLNQRKAQLNNTLEKIKTVNFPAQSIESLYKEFTRDISANGIQRARAVVTHGKYYKGNNTQIKNLVGECDPTASKWITKAKSYRKVYALPTTSNPTGANEYLFKFNIKIESNAQFPVFDINIKLPKEVARSAAEKQWYKKITMNGKILKNEGRFRIIAPTADNNYECQITPVQMDKGKDNILEVQFKHSSFKVFEVSAMAQKPIIKKN
ncbi:hypothetical protein ACFLSX_00085 [Calditrichota bacterium]